MKRIVVFLAMACTLAVQAQPPAEATSADIYLALRKLNVVGSVLYIAAHPDDENTRLLAYLSKDKLYRTGYLSLTRGDGGQNLIGNEQGIPLGLIRTQELLSARRIDGAEQFFTRAFDFGFSKNPQETFTKWDKEKVLSDVVWVIRNFKPDVIITRFPTTGEGGHGHHTASAILANEAFTAAADPTRFPEQLKYVQPWQAKRILWNTFSFGSTNTTSNDQFHFDVGGFNPVLGKSYGEIAAESRSQHKSQGFGVARSRGEAFEYFKTTGGPAPNTDLMDGVDISWNRVKGAEKAAALIQQAIASFNLMQPEQSLSLLVQIHQALQSLPEGYWRNKKLGEVEQVMAWCSGLWMEAFTGVPNAVQGDSVTINFNLTNRSRANVVLKKITMESVDTALNAALGDNKNFTLSKIIAVAKDKPISQPYWLREKMSEGLYTVNDQQLIGQPNVTPPYVATFHMQINGEPLSYTRPVQYKHTDPVKGELYEPLSVLPPLTILESPDIVVLQKDKKESKPVVVQVTAHKKVLPSKAVIELRSPNYYTTRTDSSFALDDGGNKTYAFNVSNTNSPANSKDLIQGTAHISSGKNSTDAYLAMTTIHYEHIPVIRYFYADHVQLLNLDLKTAGKKIGYIEGAGDKVPEALEQMGYEVTLLTESNISRMNLQQFDAIITGVRAYNTDEWLNAQYPRLMNYIAQGGNLIVQYNTSNQLGGVRARIAPYNFSISRNRITNENAPVTILAPNHPVFNYPNKISQEDFKDWIQERSIYHATDWDSHFEPLLSMSDPGEQPDNGSLIVSKYGKGYFTYTGLVFFRELPAGVPGAYRLLANLIALNQKKEF